jgi:pimeloyl-ACP methyl ester carboxylesterase
MRELRNIRVALALHTLQHGEGVPLLMLHALGGCSDDFRAHLPRWQGPVYALDFSGHGRSGRVYGGGYQPELWAADADQALATLADPAVVFGAGIGAYVALLLAGGRPEQVRCAVLAPGAGLDGGGTEPGPSFALPDLVTTPLARELQASSCTDACVFEGQDTDVRPPDYALRFAARARRIVLLEDAAARPPWWRAMRDAATVERSTDANAWPRLVVAAS